MNYISTLWRSSQEQPTWRRAAPRVGVLAALLMLGCTRNLPSTLSVEQRREVIHCLEKQGHHTAELSAPCRNAVWAALAEAEANAGCQADSDCFTFPMSPSDGPCWNATSSHWLDVHPQTGSLSRIREACGHVDSVCYPEPPPRAYCDAGHCRLRDYPPPMSVPRNFNCPEAGL
jgi:hypothetical protein